MAETTGQQSSMVAHDITRNPASIWLSPMCDETADHGEGRTWAAPAPAETCEDCSEPWVEYVRSDLASVSSASAIKASAEVSLMYLQTGFIECPQCGEEVPTKELDAAYELATVVEPAPAIGGTVRPEPVPATNQAGKVKAWLYQREGCASVVAKNAHRWANADGWTETPLFAALATQPATSQEGDVAKYADMDIDERATAMADDCVGDPWELLGFFREKLRQSEANAEAAKAAAIGFAQRLAATPTPPTLSEDLREALELLRRREVQMMGAAISTRNWHDMETAYNAGRDRLDAVLIEIRRAALAQVKAS